MLSVTGEAQGQRNKAGLQGSGPSAAVTDTNPSDSFAHTLPEAFPSPFPKAFLGGRTAQSSSWGNMMHMRRASTYWRHSVKAGRGERREMWDTMAEVDMKRERMLIELQNASPGERALCGAVTRAEGRSDMGVSVCTDF
ncbi:hypothetical protein EYF80_034123 [Liparis tanakae]|uniref:Uncharacterized protein n=1 Tax=Liparis tanakae TaxID=230148 RepID=A0A4Z2GPT2_9TELE|nr:hypothetical protein EYF80_034123 [Liparis tanakae]